MTVKNTYWLIGPDNTFTQVEGAARRDELAEQGWTATEEPTGPDRAWMQHDLLRTFSLFPVSTVEAWQARGWELAVPPTQRTDTGWLVVLPNPGDQVQPTAAAISVEVAPEPTVETTAVTPPPADEAQTSKEARRGR